MLDAEPGAVLGIGTRQPMSADALLDAARDGTIEALIDWRPARRGQFLYNPGGTVHAIGAGLTILEIQQPFDVTYRLFDYGRERDLHLAEGRDVVTPIPHIHLTDRDIDERQSSVLCDGPWFGAAWCFREPPLIPANAAEIQLLPIDAPVGEVQPGQCALIDDLAVLRSAGAFVLAWATSSRAR